MKKSSLYRCLQVMFFIILFITPIAGYCQGDPGCDPLDPLCPIDGGLSFLIAAGVGIAARKAYKSNKSSEEKSILK